MEVLRLIDLWGEQLPERVAFISRQGRLTYGELSWQSDALASWILAVFPGDRSPVIVYGHKEPAMLVCFIACVKAGHAYIPVDSSLPAERVGKVLRDSRAKLVLCAASEFPVALSPEAVLVDVAGDKGLALESVLTSFAGRHPQANARVTVNDNYYIIYTSGSTGEPKGVQITLGCLQSFLDWTLELHRFRSGQETFLNQAPFSFDLSVMDLYWSLSTGGTLWSVDKQMIVSPRQLFEALPDPRLTIWVSTPSFAEMCLAEKAFGRSMLPELNAFVFCGEVLTNDCAARLLERFPGAQVFNMYGPTEATVAVTSVAISMDMAKADQPLPVGYPKPQGEVLVVGKGGELPREGQRGEIIIAGDSVSPGYFGNAQLTAERFFTYYGRDGKTWRAYRTGDEGYFRDGLLHFSGRMDSQVKLHGYRIELGDIEGNLRTIPWVENAVVLPVFRDGRCEYLVGFVVCRRRPEGTDFEVGVVVREELKRRLPDYMVPRKIFVKDHFPMTSNGKIDRKALMGGVQ